MAYTLLGAKGSMATSWMAVSTASVVQAFGSMIPEPRGSQLSPPLVVLNRPAVVAA
jgi:hypothetical protein